MPKQRKDSTKVEFNLNKFIIGRVKPDSNYNVNDIERLNLAYNSAVTRIGLVTDILTDFIEEINLYKKADHEKYQPILKLAQRFFNFDPISNEDIILQLTLTLRCNLLQMKIGLEAEHLTLYIAEATKEKSKKEYGYVYEDFLPDTIFLDFDLLKKPVESIEFLALILLHEASHLFASTKDHKAYFNKTEFNKDFLSSPKSEPLRRPCLDRKLTDDQKLTHADTYAYFVTELSNIIARQQKIKLDTVTPVRAFSKASYNVKLFTQRKIANTTLSSSTGNALAIKNSP